MMKKLLISTLMLASYLGFSQEFSQKRSDYNITEESVNMVFSRAWTDEYSFDVTTSRTTIYKGDTIKEEISYSYDPTKAVGNRWETTGGTNLDVSLYEAEAFINTGQKSALKKGRNEVPKAVSLDRIKFDSVGTDYIVFGFDADPNDLPEKYKYVAALKGYILISKETKKFEKIVVQEKQPYKGVVGDVQKLNAEYFYKYDKENDKAYLTEQTVYMEIKSKDEEPYIMDQKDVYTNHVLAAVSDKQKKKNAKNAEKARKKMNK